MLRDPVNTPAAMRPRVALAGLASAVAMLAGGCSSSPIAQHSQAAWKLDGAPVQANPVPRQTAEAAPKTPKAAAIRSLQPKYVYRGGRDPKTGRADIQM